MEDKIWQAIKKVRDKSPGKIIAAQEIHESIYRAGIKEVVEWIKKHELTSPDDNSITRFYPFYHIEERELKEWE